MKKHGLMEYSKILRPTKMLFKAQFKIMPFVAAVMALTSCIAFENCRETSSIRILPVIASITMYYLLELLSVSVASSRMAGKYHDEKKNILFYLMPDRTNVMKKAFLADDLTRLIFGGLYSVILIVIDTIIMKMTGEAADIPKSIFIMLSYFASVYAILQFSVFAVRITPSVMIQVFCLYGVLILYSLCQGAYAILAVVVDIPLAASVLIAVFAVIVSAFVTVKLRKMTYVRTMMYRSKEK